MRAVMTSVLHKRIGICVTSVIVMTALLATSGCSHSRPLRLQARDDFEKKEFAAAELKLTSPEVVGETKSRLITLLDLGAVAHNKGEYEKSLLFFEKANDLAQELYTKSVSEKALSVVFNDNSQTYPGLDYEISMVHYYLVMNNLLLAQEGKSIAWEMPLIKDGDTIFFDARKAAARTLSPKEISEFQNHANAEVLAWDSYLDTIRSQNRGKPVYQDDIGAKVLAAYVHRMTGDKADKNIAQILYDNANDILWKRYGMFPSFNKLSEKFVSNYSSLGTLAASNSDDVVKSQYIARTENYDRLEKYLKISSQAVVGTKTSGGNAMIVLESGMIPEKREKVYNIGIGTLINQIQDQNLRTAVAAIGTEALLEFLPLVVIAGAVEEGIDESEAEQTGAENPNKNDAGKQMTSMMDKSVGFKFKLPYIPKVLSDANYSVVLTNKADANKVEVPMVVVDPISDFAWHEVDVKSSAIEVKTGIRVGLKYLAALIPAYWAYKKTLDSTGASFFANLAASAVWIVGKKAVDATESADIRAWNLLPQTISMMESKIPPGKYTVVAKGSRGSENWSEKLDDVEVLASHPNVLRLRVMHTPKPKPASNTTNKMALK